MIDVSVNGTLFTFWETATVGRSLDNSTGSFSFSTSSLDPQDFPVKAGDFVKVFVGGEQKIHGFVDTISASGDDQSHTINVSGRDNLADLIESSVPDSQKAVEGARTLKVMCESVISGLGASISVVDNSGEDNTFSDDELESAESGQQCMSFLQSYSRKKSVFLVPSGDGSLVIYRPGDTKATSPLLHQENNNSNNIKSWSVNQKYNNRFNKYVCKSQDNVCFSESADYADGTDRNGEVTDEQIRESRQLEIVAEESMTDSECLERAKEESNIRRARSTEYKCVVAGVAQSDNTVWDIGQRVDIDDDYADVHGEFLIRSVEYSVSLSGTTTNITCAPIDAYTVQAVASTASTRKSSNGTMFTRSIPETATDWGR